MSKVTFQQLRIDKTPIKDSPSNRSDSSLYTPVHLFGSPCEKGKGHKDGGFMGLITGEHYRRLNEIR